MEFYGGIILWESCAKQFSFHELVYRNYEYIKIEDWLHKIAYIYDATDWRYRCILEKYVDNNRYTIMSFESFRNQILS